MPVRIHLDRLLLERAMSVGDFADAVGITPANVAVLKNGRARAVRFTTLDAMCRVLQCQPGDIISWVDGETDTHVESQVTSSDMSAADSLRP